MSNLPIKQSDLIAWFEQRAEDWESDYAAIGLTESVALAVSAKTSDARNKLEAVEAATAALRTAVMAKDIALKELRQVGVGAIKQIRAYAQSTDNPQVYVEAKVPQTATPAPRPAPPMPGDLSAELRHDGSTRVTWTGSRADGVLFTIQRRTENESGPTSAWTQVGTSADMFFDDDTLPVGTTCAIYQILATRGRKSSPWSDALAVRFTPATGEHDSELGLAA